MRQKRFDTSYVGFMKDGVQWLKDNTDIKLLGKTLSLSLNLSQCRIYGDFKLAHFNKSFA